VDLTKEYPRSVRAQWQGVVQLARTIDKARAAASGTLGEYHYNCPMDQAVFAFLGIDHERLLDAIRSATSDAEIEAYTRPFVARKSVEEIDRWNQEWLTHEPDNDRSRAAFIELRNVVAPDRPDVTAWADLLDLDEKRDVPRRKAKTAA
jgi:hypothetical protein